MSDSNQNSRRDINDKLKKPFKSAWRKVQSFYKWVIEAEEEKYRVSDRIDVERDMMLELRDEKTLSALPEKPSDIGERKARLWLAYQEKYGDDKLK